MHFLPHFVWTKNHWLVQERYTHKSFRRIVVAVIILPGDMLVFGGVPQKRGWNDEKQCFFKRQKREMLWVNDSYVFVGMPKNRPGSEMRGFIPQMPYCYKHKDLDNIADCRRKKTIHTNRRFIIPLCHYVPLVQLAKLMCKKSLFVVFVTDSLRRYLINWRIHHLSMSKYLTHIGPISGSFIPANPTKFQPKT